MLCYAHLEANNTASTSYEPCNDGSWPQPCCVRGDTCGGEGLCYSPTRADALRSGYYIGGCTDLTFTSETCPRKYCSVYNDVVYNPRQQGWVCCEQRAWNATGLISNCSRQASPDFDARAPSVLFARSNMTANTTTKTSSNETDSPSQASGTIESVATNAVSNREAVDAAVTVKYVTTIIPITFVVVGILAVVFWRRRRRRRLQQQICTSVPDQPYGPQRDNVEMGGARFQSRREGAELDSQWLTPELSAQREGGELDSKWIGRERAELEHVTYQNRNMVVKPTQ